LHDARVPIRTPAQLFQETHRRFARSGHKAAPFWMEWLNDEVADAGLAEMSTERVRVDHWEERRHRDGGPDARRRHRRYRRDPALIRRTRRFECLPDILAVGRDRHVDLHGLEFFQQIDVARYEGASRLDDKARLVMQ